MKISDNFILKEIAGNYVVVPTGDNVVDFSSMITLNETGAFLWNCMNEETTEDDICKKVLSEYEGITQEEALNDIKEFVKELEKNNILE